MLAKLGYHCWILKGYNELATGLKLSQLMFLVETPCKLLQLQKLNIAMMSNYPLY